MGKNISSYTPIIKEMIDIAKERKEFLEKSRVDIRNTEYLMLCNLVHKLEGICVEINNYKNPFYHP